MRGHRGWFGILVPVMTCLLGCASTGRPPIPGTGLKEVPGTSAYAPLQRDIRTHLWKITREAHDEKCAFEAVKAEPYGSEELSRVGKSSPDSARLERKLRGEGKVQVEKWTVNCCGRLKEYEVLLIRSPNGGTDISAAELN